MMKETKIIIKQAKPAMLDRLHDAFPDRDFQDLARYMQRRMRQECDFLVAFIEDQIVGYCLVYWHSEFPKFRAKNAPEIVDLIVSPAYRRQKVASHLLKRIEQHLLAECYHYVGLTVAVTNENAQALYEKRGYEIIAQNHEKKSFMLMKDLLG